MAFRCLSVAIDYASGGLSRVGGPLSRQMTTVTARKGQTTIRGGAAGRSVAGLDVGCGSEVACRTSQRVRNVLRCWLFPATPGGGGVDEIVLRPSLAALLLLSAVGLGAGRRIAYATIPDSGNVYTACMLKATGTIRLIDTSLPASNLLGHCTALEKQVSWSQIGPRGLPDTTALQGTTGHRGMTARVLRPTPTSSLRPSSATPRHEFVLNAPAGSYLVSFRVDIFNVESDGSPNANAINPNCFVFTSGSSDGTVEANALIQPGGFATLTATGASPASVGRFDPTRLPRHLPGPGRVVRGRPTRRRRRHAHH